MKIKTFEDYLEDVFINGEGSMTLDDDLPDAFNSWLQNLSVDEFIEHGNMYGEYVRMVTNS